MTISNTKNRWDYVGNGTAGPFVYDNLVLNANHLKVYVSGSLKTLNTHYTVSGIGNPGGGNVTFTGGNEPPNLAPVLLLRVVPLTQLSDYVNHDALNAETLERDLDKLVMITQQLDELGVRTLKVPETSTLTNLTVPVVPSGILMWDATATQILAVTTSTQINFPPGGSVGQVQFNDGGFFGGDSGLTYNKTTKRLNASIEKTVTQGSGLGSVVNWSLGTPASPLMNEIPVVITHYATGLYNNHAIHINTTADTIGGGSGLVVENFGRAAGAIFAVGSGNSNPNACAILAFINHTLDVHDQYGIIMTNAHGRAISIQSHGTGEAIEIRRTANHSGTTKSGSHIFINEAIADYGHLIGLRMDIHSSRPSSDVMIQVRRGSTTTFRLEADGSIVSEGAVYLPNNRAVFIKDSGGTYRNMLILNSNNDLVIGNDLSGPNKLRLNVDGVAKQVTVGATDSGGTGFRLLRVVN